MGGCCAQTWTSQNRRVKASRIKIPNPLFIDMMMTPFLFNVSHYDMGYIISLSFFREGVYISFIFVNRVLKFRISSSPYLAIASFPNLLISLSSDLPILML
jgi:hypothetical protein